MKVGFVDFEKEPLMAGTRRKAKAILCKRNHQKSVLALKRQKTGNEIPCRI